MDRVDGAVSAELTLLGLRKRTVYPGDEAQTPPARPTIAALVILPVPMRLLSTYAEVHRPTGQ